MGCHGEFQLGRELDCQDIVEIIKQINYQSSFLDIKQIKLLFLLRKNRVYSRKYWCYCCYCCYYYAVKLSVCTVSESNTGRIA